MVVDSGASFGTSLLQPEAENASDNYRSVNVIRLILRVLFSHQCPGFKLYLCIKDGPAVEAGSESTELQCEESD